MHARPRNGLNILFVFANPNCVKQSEVSPALSSRLTLPVFTESAGLFLNGRQHNVAAVVATKPEINEPWTVQAGNLLQQKAVFFLWREDYTEERKTERVPNRVEAAPRTQINACLINMFVVCVRKGSCFTAAASSSALWRQQWLHTAIKLNRRHW